jgi:hypothetical protein
MEKLIKSGSHLLKTDTSSGWLLTILKAKLKNSVLLLKLIRSSLLVKGLRRMVKLLGRDMRWLEVRLRLFLKD